jgi:RNA processing factor Prp31
MKQEKPVSNLLIVDKNKLAQHGGEEWDDYIEVDPVVTTDALDTWANRIQDRIRKLAATKEGEIAVTVDAHPVYTAVVDNLIYTMKQKYNIIVLMARV